MLHISIKILLTQLRSFSHRGPHPADATGLGGSRAELVESQRRWGAREQTILKQPPTLVALGSQALEVLPQKLHSVVVLSQAFLAIPLAPQPQSHACRVDGLPHQDSFGSADTFCWTLFGCVELQYDLKMPQLVMRQLRDLLRWF